MHLTIAYSKIKKRNLVLINNATYQRETLSERPIRQPLRSVIWVSLFAPGLWSAIWVSFLHSRSVVRVTFQSLGMSVFWVKNEVSGQWWQHAMVYVAPPWWGCVCMGVLWDSLNRNTLTPDIVTSTGDACTCNWGYPQFEKRLIMMMIPPKQQSFPFLDQG